MLTNEHSLSLSHLPIYAPSWSGRELFEHPSYVAGSSSPVSDAAACFSSSALIGGLKLALQKDLQQQQTAAELAIAAPEPEPEPAGTDPAGADSTEYVTPRGGILIACHNPASFSLSPSSSRCVFTVL